MSEGSNLPSRVTNVIGFYPQVFRDPTSRQLKKRVVLRVTVGDVVRELPVTMTVARHLADSIHDAADAAQASDGELNAL